LKVSTSIVLIYASNIQKKYKSFFIFIRAVCPVALCYIYGCNILRWLLVVESIFSWCS